MRTPSYRPLLGAVVLSALVSLPSVADAKLKIFSCLPEWTALAKDLGGDAVEVFTAASPLKDPDHVDVTPALISALSQADMLICTGGYEDEWLVPALQRAQNPKLAKGRPGAFYTRNFVKLIEDKHESKSGGDKHGHKAGSQPHDEGNPHVQGDPHRVRTIAGQLARRMIEVDPPSAAVYGERVKTVIRDLGALITELERKAAPLKGVNVVVQHVHSDYLLAWLKINIIAIVEPNPGVPPGPADLTRVVTRATKGKAKLVIHAAYEDPRSSQYVTERVGIPLVKLPFTVGGTDDSKTFADFYRSSVDRLLDGLAGRGRS